MKRALSILLHIFVYAAIIGGVLFGLPKFLSWKLETDYPMAAITSGSMWPALKIKDIVLIQGVKGGNVGVGDIVVYQSEKGGSFTIHRVIQIEKDYVITKGDANFQEDTPVRKDSIIGKALEWRGKTVRIPWLGALTVIASAPR